MKQACQIPIPRSRQSDRPATYVENTTAWFSTWRERDWQDYRNHFVQLNSLFYRGETKYINPPQKFYYNHNFNKKKPF